MTSRRTVLQPNRAQSDVDIHESLKSRSAEVSRNVLDTEKIIFQSPDYLCIDKPHDLRMNGDFEHTVEKLVMRSFPDLLSNAVNLKWIHQLDYATSGALCIGLNREAAARASLAFSARLTNKAYLAIVEGHLDMRNIKASTGCPADRATCSIEANEQDTGAAVDPQCRSKPTSTWQDEVHLNRALAYFMAYHLFTVTPYHDLFFEGSDCEFRQALELVTATAGFSWEYPWECFRDGNV